MQLEKLWKKNLVLFIILLIIKGRGSQWLKLRGKSSSVPLNNSRIGTVEIPGKLSSLQGSAEKEDPGAAGVTHMDPALHSRSEHSVVLRPCSVHTAFLIYFDMCLGEEYLCNPALFSQKASVPTLTDSERSYQSSKTCYWLTSRFMFVLSVNSLQ